MQTSAKSPRHPARDLPSLNSLLERPDAALLLEQYGRDAAVRALRQALERNRRDLLAENGRPSISPDPHLLIDEAARSLEDETRPTLRRAINATGIVIHTGLGRSVLAAEAVQEVCRAAASHSLLEVDAETGSRGSRQVHVRELLRQLTGAEEALAVNNNAAAVLLAISSLAAGREVVISRGQLVEIGGSFRIPDIIRQSGAVLVEVGATNRTHLRDFEQAITERTALILRVHTSNFRMVGFTGQPGLEELVNLGRKHGVPVMDDLGSGALLDPREMGLPDEPPVAAAVAAGADLVTFSGDKLLGSSQAGLIIGRSALLAAMATHPLMRAVRLDKLTLAALSATLRLYMNPEQARRRIPTLRALSRSPEELEQDAAALAARLTSLPCDLSLVEGESQVGGGALPGVDLPTKLVQIRPHRQSCAQLAASLRSAEPSVWVRIREEAVLLDPRTLLPGEIEEVAALIAAQLKEEIE